MRPEWANGLAESNGPFAKADDELFKGTESSDSVPSAWNGCQPTER